MHHHQLPSPAPWTFESAPSIFSQHHTEPRSFHHCWIALVSWPWGHPRKCSWGDFHSREKHAMLLGAVGSAWPRMNGLHLLWVCECVCGCVGVCLSECVCECVFDRTAVSLTPWKPSMVLWVCDSSCVCVCVCVWVCVCNSEWCCLNWNWNWIETPLWCINRKCEFIPFTNCFAIH